MPGIIAERRFTAQRFDVVSGPAEPGFSWGVHSTCEEVRLVLGGDARFRLQLGSYYSDWGEWQQDLLIYEGTYEEQAEGVICRSVSKTIDNYFYDHELGETRKHKDKNACEHRFDFRKRSDQVLVCPLEHGGLAGVVMTTGVEPMRNLKRRR